MKDLFIKKQIKIIILSIILFFFLINSSITLENKIKYKVNNEIITTLDIEFEKQYLLALNPNLKKFSDEEIIRISEKSILNEKIKEQEINKFFNDAIIPDEYLEKLLKNIYIKIGIENLQEFKNYLRKENIIYQHVKNKITIEALWNEIILNKFSSQIKIDENELKKKIKKNKNTTQKSFLLSEIYFEINQNEKLKKKFVEIEKIINENGFENAALKYSISQTATIGGKLDWISENSLNKNIRNKINSTKIGNYTDPIRVATGFLILKINDVKIIKSNIDINKELKKLINLKRSEQLNQFSKMYFNKIKKNSVINEI